MDDDIVGDDKIGKCKINLEELDLSEPCNLKEKVDENWFSADAYIYLTLTWEE